MNLEFGLVVEVKMKKGPEKKMPPLTSKCESSDMNVLGKKKLHEIIFSKIVKFAADLQPEDVIDTRLSSDYSNILEECKHIFLQNVEILLSMAREYIDKPPRHASKLKIDIQTFNILYFIRFRLCLDLYSGEYKSAENDVLLSLQSEITQKLYQILIKLLPVDESQKMLPINEINMGLIEKYRIHLDKIGEESNLLWKCGSVLKEDEKNEQILKLVSLIILFKIRMTFYYINSQPTIAFRAANEAIMIFNHFQEKLTNSVFPYRNEIRLILEKIAKIDSNTYCCAFVFNAVIKEYSLSNEIFYLSSHFLSQGNFTDNARQLYSNISLIQDALQNKIILRNMHKIFENFIEILNWCNQSIDSLYQISMISCLKYLIEISKKYFQKIENPGFYLFSLIELLDKIFVNVIQVEKTLIPTNTTSWRNLIKSKNFSVNENLDVIDLFWSNCACYSFILDDYYIDLSSLIINIENDRSNATLKIHEILKKCDNLINVIDFFINVKNSVGQMECITFFIAVLGKIAMLFNVIYFLFSKAYVSDNCYNFYFESLLLYINIINKIENILQDNEMLKNFLENIRYNDRDLFKTNLIPFLQSYEKFSLNYNQFEIVYNFFISKFLNLNDAKLGREIIQTYICKFVGIENDSSSTKEISNKSLVSVVIMPTTKIIVIILRKVFDIADKVCIPSEEVFAIPEIDTNFDDFRNIVDNLSSIKVEIQALIDKSPMFFLQKAPELLDRLCSLVNLIRCNENQACYTQANSIILTFIKYFKFYKSLDSEKILIIQIQEKLSDICRFFIERLQVVQRLEKHQSHFSINTRSDLSAPTFSAKTQHAIDCIVDSLELSDVIPDGVYTNTTVKSRSRTKKADTLFGRQSDFSPSDILEHPVKYEKRSNRLGKKAKTQILQQQAAVTQKPAPIVHNVPSQLVCKANVGEDPVLLLGPTAVETAEERKARREATHWRKNNPKRKQQPAQSTTPKMSRRELKRQQQRLQKEQKEAAKLAKEAENELRRREREKTKKLLCAQEPKPLASNNGDIEGPAIAASSASSVDIDNLAKNLGSISLHNDEESEMDNPMPPLSPAAIETTTKSNEPTTESENDYSLDFQIEYPEEIQNIFNILTSAGYKCYLRGGFPRDYILKKVFNDYDLVTDCPGDKLLNLLEGFIQCPFEGKENLYQLGDIIDIVSYPSLSINDLKALASQADISLNSLFTDKDGRIMDFLKRYKDFGLEKIHVLGDIRTRLALDPNLILRLIRHSNHVDKTITDHDLGIMQEMTPQITNLCPFGVYLKSINDMFSRGEGHKNYLFLLNKSFLPGLLLALPSYEPYDFDIFFENKIMKMDSEGNLTPYKTNLGYDFIALMLLRKILCGVALADLLREASLLNDEIEMFWQNYQGEPAKSLEKTKYLFAKLVHMKMQGFLNDFNKCYNPDPHQHQQQQQQQHNSYTPGYQTRYVDTSGYLQTSPMTVNAPLLTRSYRN